MSLGTHAYVLTADYLDVPHPWAPQVPMGRWLAVAVPGHFDEAGRALSAVAAARIRMPEGFARAVYLMLAPGSTMLVTDAPILSESTADDFTVLSDGPPAS